MFAVCAVVGLAKVASGKLSCGMSDTVEVGRDQKNGRFLPGNNTGRNGGRPKGARDRHTRNFLEAFADDFEKHGVAVIEQVREEQPAVYLKVASDLLPRHAELDVTVDVFHEVSSVLQAYRVASELLGADPAAGVRRLRRIAPRLESVDDVE